LRGIKTVGGQKGWRLGHTARGSLLIVGLRVLTGPLAGAREEDLKRSLRGSLFITGIPARRKKGKNGAQGERERVSIETRGLGWDGGAG